MGNIKGFLNSVLFKCNLKMPTEYKVEFNREVVKQNFNRLSITLTSLFILECVLMFFESNLFFTGHLIVKFIIILFFMLPFVWFVRFKADKINTNFANVILFLVIAACIIFGASVALFLQDQVDLVHLYLVMVFYSSVFFLMRPAVRGILLFTTLLYFLVQLPNYAQNPELFFTIRINTIASNIAAWAMANFLWRAQINVFINKKLLYSQNLKLIELNDKDSMTGLYNHEASFRVLKSEVNLAKARGYPLSLIIADIDDFKLVNDRYGHQAGDDVLKHFSKLLVSIVRKDDSVGRYGGEEFIIIMPKTHLKEALKLADRIKEALAEKQFNNIRFTISGGVGHYDGGDIEDFIKNADKNLYKAKENGKNQFVSSLV